MIIVCTFFLFWMYTREELPVSAYPQVKGISRGMVCKSLALACTGQEACERADRGVVQLSDRDDWYAPYYSWLVQEGILAETIANSSQLSMEMSIRTGELRQILERMKLTELGEFYLQADDMDVVSAELYWELYERILQKTDPLHDVKEISLCIYGTAANLTDAAAWQCYTSEGNMGFSGLALDYYIDSRIIALCRDHEIIAVLGQENEEEEISQPEPQTEEQMPEQQMIRVLLCTTDYTSCFHPYVELTCEQPWILQCGDDFEEIEAGELVHIDSGDERLLQGTITAHATQGELFVPSIHRALGTPSYGGKIEISDSEQGLLLVNELPLESYLIKVVPSEMPSRYGLETARLQAVCARSYAIRQMEQNACRAYHAHVDDSTAFQVYNNVAAQPISIQAVRDTQGEVLMVGEEIISAYFFSTSCGSTTDITSWTPGAACPAYLSAKQVMSPEQPDLNLADEGTFDAFISDWNQEAFEQGTVWYRWKYSISLETLGELIRSRLPGVISQCGQAVQWETEEGLVPADSSVDSGSLQSITVLQRGSGGIVQELLLTGSNGSLHIIGQTAIRKLFASPDYLYENGSETGISRSESTLLPSAFFCLQPLTAENEEGAEVLTGYTVCGGGNGHGIGMSQNGAYAMANQGMNYREILQFFYNGAEICTLGEDFAQN